MVLKKKIVRYCCEVCKTDYGNKKLAEACEKKSVEKLPDWIAVGKEVISDFYCGNCSLGFTIGKISKIVGPTLPIPDLEIHSFHNPARRGIHTCYLYVAARCGCCKRNLEFIKAACEVQENKRF